MRSTPVPYILVGNVLHGLLHCGYGLTSDQASNTQRHSGHPVWPSFSSQIFELTDNRFQYFTRSQQAFSFLRALPFLFHKLQQLLAKAARCGNGCLRQDGSQFRRHLGMNSLVPHIVFGCFDHRQHFSPAAYLGSELPKPSQLRLHLGEFQARRPDRLSGTQQLRRDRRYRTNGTGFPPSRA